MMLFSEVKFIAELPSLPKFPIPLNKCVLDLKTKENEWTKRDVVNGAYDLAKTYLMHGGGKSVLGYRVNEGGS